LKNLRFILLVLCLVIDPGKLITQPVIEWTARFNGLLDSTDISNDIIVDNSGNSYITGYSHKLLGLLTGAVTISYDPDGNQRWRAEYDELLNDAGSVIVLDNTQQYVYVAGYTNGLLNLTAADYVIVKYRASDGQQIWARTYGFGLLGDDKATDIIIDSQNNPIVTGYSQGFLLLLTPFDYATIKYDENGNQLWANRYNGTGNNQDKAWSIAVDNSDNVIVTGESVGSGTDYDYATIKYNSTGTQQWVRRYNGTGNDSDRAYAIVVDNSDNITVTGGSMGNTSGLDYATVQYNSAGTQQWVSRYNGPGNNEDRAYAIVVDNSNNFVITGSSRSTNTAGSEDYATVKYNSSGTQLWAQRYNGPGNNVDRAYAIIVDNTDNILVTGSSRSTTFAGSEDYATLKYTPAGVEQWVTRYNGSGNNEDRAYAIVVDNSDNIYLTGSSRSGTFLGSEDYLSIKYSVDELVVLPPNYEIIPSEFDLYQNYPNPFNPVTQINYDLKEESFVTLKIFNNLGMELTSLVNESKRAGKYHVIWDAKDLPSGVYFYKIEVVSSTNMNTVLYNQTKKLLLIK
jgi:hypothetical protein